MLYIGIAAAFVDSIQTIPQVYKSYTTKNTKDLSYYSIGLMILSGVLWLFYGWFEQDVPILLSATPYFLFNVLLFMIKWSHDERSRACVETLDEASSPDD